MGWAEDEVEAQSSRLGMLRLKLRPIDGATRKLNCTGVQLHLDLHLFVLLFSPHNNRQIYLIALNITVIMSQTPYIVGTPLSSF